MPGLVLVPAHIGELSGAVTFDGVPTDEQLAEVAFYVPRYLGSADTLRVMARMPRLQVCQLLMAGYEHALPFLPAGVTLCNAAGVHDASTAELAVALTLARLRGIDDFARAMPEGAWIHGARDALADRRVVVVGAGGVGQAIRRRLEPFEVDVTMVGRTAREGVVAVEDLATLLPTSEVVIMAVPLSPQTHRLVDDAFLAALPDGALVVNVARGAVADTDAILRHAGRLNFALDVTDPEPLPSGHPLWHAPGVLISPHVGGNTTAFLPRARRLLAEQIERFAAGRPLSNVVVEAPAP
jgi:phosphoglycerate dehydrogenase-like enzyme